MDKLESSPYRSPVRLVLHAGEPLQPFSTQTLARARKKLLAELSLAGEQLAIDGQIYTRHDLSSLLQDISEEDWSMHCLVYTLPTLLEFLEKGSVDLEALEAEMRPYRFKPGFPEFVSEPFSLSFRDATARMIRSVEPARLALLMPFNDFVLPQHEELAYARLRRYFNELLERINGITHEHFESQRSSLNFLYSPAWINFVNVVPASLALERDQVVQSLLSLVIRFQRKATWQFLDQLCQRILLINCNPELRTRAKEASNIIHDNAKQAPARRPGHYSPPPTKSDGPGVGRIIFGVFWVIVMIFRIASTDSCRSRNSSSYRDISTQLKMADQMARPALRERSSKANEDELLRVLDSLSAHQQKGSIESPDTGEPPFAGHSQRPERYSEDNFTIVNRSGKEMIFFWFTSDNQLLDSTSAPYAVFIRKGDSVSFPMRNARVCRFGAAFGDGWSRLPNAASVQLRSYFPYSVRTADEAEGGPGSLPIRSFFRKPLSNQPFLTRVIVLSNYASRDIDAQKLYDPADPNAVHEEGRIRFFQKDGAIEAEGGGTYYLSTVARGN